MKVRFTPEAEEQADEIDTWWRQHRKDARDLFARELADMKALLMSMPKFGTVYTILDGQPVRKALMPRTRHHVYYTANTAEGLIIVHAVWGAPKEGGPKL
jgi:plasmid stabilization system protein ParE